MESEYFNTYMCIKASGMLYEYLPDATGTWKDDRKMFIHWMKSKGAK